ncbi:MAG: hypothetical protein OXR62_00435 [Ahrensia sp.]|nr:hypothetical protein [Ahrensia sp.]
MNATIIEFRNPIKPIAQFVRVDHAHRRLGDLYAAGRLPIRRAVFDASRLPAQKELADSFRHDGIEIVLDTEVAELAAREKIATHVNKAPWASVADGNVVGPQFFDGTNPHIDIIGSIARFAVQHDVDTVLAPTHFLGDRDFEGWLSIDVRSCMALRKALDREGGNHIAIDYSVIHSHVALNQTEQRSELITRISDLPIDNVWVRASGLGNEPKPQTTRQFLASMYGLHNLGKPIIADYSDGLMAHALLAFGGVSGVAHGIGERGKFDAGGWHKEPTPRDESNPFRRATYIPISGLGRAFKGKEIELLASAKGGRKLVGCQNECCAHGVQDMKSDPRQHAANESLAPIRALASVPDFNREDYFLSRPLREAETLARNLKDLNPSQKDAERLDVNLESLKKRLGDHHRKIGKLSDTLGLLHDERGAGAPRAPVAMTRGGEQSSKERKKP